MTVGGSGGGLYVLLLGTSSLVQLTKAVAVAAHKKRDMIFLIRVVLFFLGLNYYDVILISK